MQLSPFVAVMVLLATSLFPRLAVSWEGPSTVLPDFGSPGQSENVDPQNASVAVNSALDIHYHGKHIHLSQGASRSALEMIRHFSRPVIAENLNGSRILELGSGTGLAGMAALLHGASVDFTDQSIVMDVLEDNLNANLESGLLQRVGLHELQWHDDNRNHPLADIHYDYIIAADVVYARESIQPLVNTFRRFGNDQTVVYLAYVQRFPWAKRFFDSMDAHFQRRLLGRENGVWLFEFRSLDH